MILAIARTYFFYFARIAMSLAILPILSHGLGAEGFGIALVVQSLGLFGSLIVQFGFHSSAARAISLADATQERDAVIARVLGAQLLLALGTAVLIGAAAWATPIFGHSPWAVASAIAFALGTGLIPAWYFRGTERAATGIALEVAGQVVALTILVAAVRTPDDVGLALMAMAVAPVISALAGLAWMLAERGKLAPMRPGPVFLTIHQGLPLFLVRASSSGFTFGSVWLVGLMASAEDAAYFGVAAKLVQAFTTLSQPITFSLMPHIAKAAAASLGEAMAAALKWSGALLALAVLAAMFITVFAEPLIALVFAPDMAPAAAMTKVFAWVCVLAALREGQGELFLVPLHHDRSVAASVMLGGAAGLVAALWLVPHFGGNGMVMARLIGETAISLAMALAIARLLRGADRAAPFTRT